MTSVFSILNEMSSAFNNQALPALGEKLPSVNEDTTLKWRGLLNNTYASKEKDVLGNREMRKRSTSAKEKGNETDARDADPPTQDSGSGDGGVASAQDSEKEAPQQSTEVPKGGTTEASAVAVAREMENENSSMVTDTTQTTTTSSTTSSSLATTSNTTSSAAAAAADNSTEGTTINSGDKPVPDKKSSRPRSKPVLVDKSDRSLRSNRTNNGATPPNTTPVVVPPSPAVALPKVVRRGRRRKDEQPTPPPAPQIATKGKAPPPPTPPPEEIKTQPSLPSEDTAVVTPKEDEKPRLIVTIRPKAASVVVTRTTPEVATKRRGRKPGQGQQKRPEPLSQRPLRRIKPTQKILDCDELREGFVQQNCARLNITNEELKTIEENNAKEKNEEDRRQTRRVKRETPKSEPIPDTIKIERTPPNSTSAENTESKKHHEHRITSVESRSVKRHLSFSDVYKNMPRKPCPDPDALLKEIRSSKLNVNKSPEDNKKLNKKQLKRLQKVKEKHFQLLGLQRVRHANGSDTENSDEAEEFVPKKKLSNVGKPGVTLRLRNFRKDDKETRVPAKKRKREVDVDLMPATKKVTAQQHEQRDKEPVTVPPVTEELVNGLQVVPAAASVTAMETAPGVLMEDTNLICYCAQPSKYFLQRTAAISHCCAIDEVEGQKIGCTNEIHGDLLQLLRPSIRTSYMVLCESHKKRLVSHNCCAGCGIFLTQGIFSLCQSKHFFHRDCTMKYILNAPYDPSNPDFTGPTLAFKCPHCGIDVPDSSFRVTMKSENVPVFFTNPKHHLQRAKMSISNKPNVSANSFLLNVERLIPEEILTALQQASEHLKANTQKKFTARDLLRAIYHDSGVQEIAEIVASGFDLTKPYKEYNNQTCLHLVSSLGNIATLYLILSRTSSDKFINVMDKERRTAVMCAVVGRKNDILKVLVQFGADVTLKGPDGMSALHLAAKFGNFAAAQIILDHYRQTASITRTEKFLNMTDNGHWTALVWAAEIGHADIVSYFISLGADVNVCDLHNNTVLHWAALSGKIDTVYPLMLPNTHFNRQNINGDTALHIACRQGNTRICLALVANGTNLYTKNAAGETPYDCIPDEKSQCARVLQFNMEMRSLGNYKERKIMCHDISNGRECYPIQMLRRIGNDNDDAPQPDFKYITKCIVMQDTVQIDQRVSQMQTCSCTDACTSGSCQCGELSIQIWYNADGRLISDFNYTDPAMIFECSDTCGCNIKVCKNRVVQQGTKLPFQVFECEDQVKGYGVRCMSKILRGTFIAEYVGEIMTDAEADARTDDSFYFEVGASEHCIDAKFYGNVTRFFNHSCNSNIIPIRVYFEHQDIRFPKIAFFASRDIEPEEELTFDYGTKFWLAKYNQFTCHCGSKKCRYSTTTITKTLEEYNQRINSTN